jgi:hypothetical protein
VSIVQGPKGMESANEVREPYQSARNRLRRVRFQVAQSSIGRCGGGTFVGGHEGAVRYLRRRTGRISAGLLGRVCTDLCGVGRWDCGCCGGLHNVSTVQTISPPHWMLIRKYLPVPTILGFQQGNAQEAMVPIA